MIKFTPRNYLRLVKYIAENGKDVQVDGRLTKEIMDAEFVIDDPRDRLVISPARKINVPFAVAEWVGLMTGESSLAFFQQYIQSFDEYSSDGVFVDGAYGQRIWRLPLFNQIGGVIQELTRDPLSRRAVITLYDGPTDLYGGGGKSTPCTLSIQFLIRDGKLNALTTMRSNDVVFGVSYDIFMFTMLQEFLARRLDVGLGQYYHRAGSLHLYERDFSLLAADDGPRWTRVMRDMPKLTIANVAALRRKLMSDEGTLIAEPLQPYLTDFLMADKAFKRRKTDERTASILCDTIADPTVRKAMRLYLGE